MYNLLNQHISRLAGECSELELTIKDLLKFAPATYCSIEKLSETKNILLDCSRQLYSLYEKRMALMGINTKIVWRDCLDFKRHISIDTWHSAKDQCKLLSYEFFTWNGLIYSSRINDDMIPICEESEVL